MGEEGWAGWTARGGGEVGGGARHMSHDRTWQCCHRHPHDLVGSRARKPTFHAHAVTLPARPHSLRQSSEKKKGSSRDCDAIVIALKRIMAVRRGKTLQEGNLLYFIFYVDTL